MGRSARSRMHDPSVEPEPAALGLLVGNLQPLAPPDPFDPLVVDDPARLLRSSSGDLAIAVAAILAGQFDDVGGQPLFVFSAPRDLALRRAVLPERRAGPALGDMLQLWIERARCRRGGARGLEVSPGSLRRIILSSVRSETALRRRAFSVSRSFNRFT